MRENLTQSEVELLGAWLDGELTVAEARRVEALVASDDRLRRGVAELRALAGLLDVWEVPAARADLPARIVAQVKSQAGPRVLYRFAGWAAAAAAIAVLAVGAWIWLARSSDTAVKPSDGIATLPMPVKEEFVVENLDFFQDYDVVMNLETLDELDRLESASPGS